jgi:hypothetical protein
VVLAVARAFQPHVWLNVHSGMEALFTPYDHKASVPEGPEAQLALQMLRVINHDLCRGACVIGSGGKSVGSARASHPSLAPFRPACTPPAGPCSPPAPAGQSTRAAGWDRCSWQRLLRSHALALAPPLRWTRPATRSATSPPPAPPPRPAPRSYLAHGTATDYMYEVLKVPLAMTWEIYGDMKAHFNDCFRMFNPLEKEHFTRVGATAGTPPGTPAALGGAAHW